MVKKINFPYSKEYTFTPNVAFQYYLNPVVFPSRRSNMPYSNVAGRSQERRALVPFALRIALSTGFLKTRFLSGPQSVSQERSLFYTIPFCISRTQSSVALKDWAILFNSPPLWSAIRLPFAFDLQGPPFLCLLALPLAFRYQSPVQPWLAD